MTDFNREGYNLYTEFDQISYHIISYLMDNNEMIWKLLKYKTPDAWNKADLTKTEKAQMIYNGQDDSTGFYVFLDEGIPDVHTREDCIIRVEPIGVNPDGRTVGTLMISLEVYAHFKINTLSNYTTRVNTIMKEFLQTLNGVQIEGIIGRLYFDGLASTMARLSVAGQLPFKGKQVIMSAKSG